MKFSIHTRTCLLCLGVRVFIHLRSSEGPRSFAGVGAVGRRDLGQVGLRPEQQALSSYAGSVNIDSSCELD